MTLNEVTDQEDFKWLIRIYQTSPVPIEEREQAIKRAEATYPQFAKAEKAPTAELEKEMKQGEAELPKGGEY